VSVSQLIIFNAVFLIYREKIFNFQSLMRTTARQKDKVIHNEIGPQPIFSLIKCCLDLDLMMRWIIIHKACWAICKNFTQFFLLIYKQTITAFDKWFPSSGFSEMYVNISHNYCENVDDHRTSWMTTSTVYNNVIFTSYRILKVIFRKMNDLVTNVNRIGQIYFF